MNKKILLTLLSSLFILALSAKDIKVVVDSKFDNASTITLYNPGLMSKPMGNMEVKRGLNEKIYNLSESKVYNIHIQSNGKFHASVSALINCDRDEFIIELDEKGNVSFRGDYENFNNYLVSLKSRIQEDSKKLYPLDEINEERSKLAFAMYKEWGNDIKNSSLSTEEKSMLLGYIQGNLLMNVFGSVYSSKIFGKTAENLVIKENHADFMLNMKIEPYMYLFSNWHSYLTEFLYAKINKGEIKIKGINTWIRDMATSVNNRNMRDLFILETLNREVIMGYNRDIIERFENSKKLVKDDKVLAQINELQKKASTQSNLNEGMYVGDVTFEDVNGKTVSLSDFKGKYIFIDMWSTGCNPCIGEIPYMKKIEHNMSDKNIAWISVSMDTDKEVWKRFMGKNNMKGNQLLCTGGFRNPFCKTIGLRGIPHFILLDEECRIYYSDAYRPSNPVLEEILVKLTAK